MVHLDSIWIPCGVRMDPTQTPHPSLGGVPAKESPRGLHVDSTTPRGLHVEFRRNLWGRVKSSRKCLYQNLSTGVMKLTHSQSFPHTHSIPLATSRVSVPPLHIPFRHYDADTTTQKSDRIPNVVTDTHTCTIGTILHTRIPLLMLH